MGAQSEPQIENGRYVLGTADNESGFVGCDGENPGPIELVQPPAHGQYQEFVRHPNFTQFRYRPNGGYLGPDSLTFRAAGTGETVEIPLQVVPEVFGCTPAFPATTKLGQSSTGSLTCRDRFNRALAFTISGRPSHGSLSLQNGAYGVANFTYNPNGGYVGPDKWLVRVERGTNGAYAAEYSINTTVRDQSVALGCLPYTVKRFVAVAGLPERHDLSCYDDGGGPFSVSVVKPSRHGRVSKVRRLRVVVQDGFPDFYTFGYAYAARPNYRGPDRYTLRVTNRRGSVDLDYKVEVVSPFQPCLKLKGIKRARCNIRAHILTRCGPPQDNVKRYSFCDLRVRAVLRCRKAKPSYRLDCIRRAKHIWKKREADSASGVRRSRSRRVTW